MIQICTDFDGTITTKDTIVYVTEKFGAGEEFRTRVVDEIKSGEVTVFRGIQLELETVKASWEQAVKLLREDVEVDPEFENFVAWTRAKDLPLTILSSGMMPVVQLFTGHLGLPTYAHRLEVTPEGWRFEVNEENRKEKVLEKISGEGPVVYIGDGTSDLSAIPFAELLFARRGRYLEAYCRENKIPFIPYSDFAEVRTGIAQWLDDSSIE